MKFEAIQSQGTVEVIYIAKDSAPRNIKSW